MRIEFGKVGQHVASDAIVHLRGFLKMHAAQASAERAALVDLQIGPFPHAEIFRNGVAIIPDDLESISVLGDKSIAAGALENGQNVTRLDGKPFPTHMGQSKMLVQLSFKLESVGRFDPPEQPQFQWIPRLEVALAWLASREAAWSIALQTATRAVMSALSSLS